jgi:hypothetical protein
VTALAALMLLLLPAERALHNARTTLHAAGHYSVPVGCAPGDVADWVCVARLRDGYVILRCAADHAEACTMRVVRR